MVPIEEIQTLVYTIPTDGPESDGTLEWNKTTVVVVKITADGETGIGFSYAHRAAAFVIKELASFLKGSNAFDIPALWQEMVHEVRNIGRPGIAISAISAIDTALWDLKAKLMNVPLYQLWGKARQAVPVYGSGGFITYSDKQLEDQLEHWKRHGITMFKIKIGHNENEDLKRIAKSRAIIGQGSKLFVDANGAYTCKQALRMAEAFDQYDVQWFEEPVSSDDLDDLHLIRERLLNVDIAAGEYGYDEDYFRKMLQAGAVDCLQADATRCGGFTGFFQAAVLAKSFHVPFSSHTAPALHFHACLSLDHLVHMEYFYDHVRIEKVLFEGGPILREGRLWPFSGKGLGLTLKESEVGKYLIEDDERIYE